MLRGFATLCLLVLSVACGETPSDADGGAVPGADEATSREALKGRTYQIRALIERVPLKLTTYPRREVSDAYIPEEDSFEVIIDGGLSSVLHARRKDSDQSAVLRPSGAAWKTETAFTFVIQGECYCAQHYYQGLQDMAYEQFEIRSDGGDGVMGHFAGEGLILQDHLFGNFGFKGTFVGKPK